MALLQLQLCIITLYDLLLLIACDRHKQKQQMMAPIAFLPKYSYYGLEV